MSPHSNFLLMYMVEVGGDDSSRWVPAIHVGDFD